MGSETRKRVFEQAHFLVGAARGAVKPDCHACHFRLDKLFTRILYTLLCTKAGIYRNPQLNSLRFPPKALFSRLTLPRHKRLKRTKAGLKPCTFRRKVDTRGLCVLQDQRPRSISAPSASSASSSVMCSRSSANSKPISVLAVEG